LDQADTRFGEKTRSTIAIPGARARVLLASRPEGAGCISPAALTPLATHTLLREPAAIATLLTDDTDWEENRELVTESYRTPRAEEALPFVRRRL
jgi:hypothetical protein